MVLCDNVPKIHNITTIVSRFKDKLPIAVSEEILLFFDFLSTQYITSRYPDFEQRPAQQTFEGEAEQILRKTREAFSWLLTLKPSTK